MISLDDCIGLCGLDRDEVCAIAEHEHIPAINATALAQHLLSQPEGCQRIGSMIADDVIEATVRGDWRHAAELKATLMHFLADHPEASIPVRVRSRLTRVEYR